MGAYFRSIALRKAKIVCNFGLSECNRVKSGLVKSSEGRGFGSVFICLAQDLVGL